MKKTAILGSLVLMMVPLFGVSGDVKRTTALEFTSILFSSSVHGLTGKEEKEWPEVFMVAKIHGHGLGRGASLQRENLSRFFNLPDLEVILDSSEAKITWESGTWSEYRGSLPRAVQTVLLDGEDYTVFLIPHEIDVPNKVFKFILEIHRSEGPEVVSALRSSERIARGEILWDFGGPLAIGIYFPDRIYFMSWTIGIEMSAIGFRFGSGLSWTL